jgi:hypothetical protein
MMIEILPDKNDDENFVKIIEQILDVGINLGCPEEVFVVKVDHWFDFKWREFSHKIFGALGVWRKPLRIPPFIPDRIVEQKYYRKVGKYYELKDTNSIHIYQQSDWNAIRKIKRKSAIYIWFSSGTVKNSQASLMVYFFKDDFQKSWYVSFTKKSEWQIYKTDNISKAEVRSMIENDYFPLYR